VARTARIHLKGQVLSLALGETNYSGLFLSCARGSSHATHLGPALSAAQSAPRNPVPWLQDRKVDWFVPSLDELAQGAQEVLVCPIWWDVRWKLNCSETLLTWGMHGDHAIKVLRPVTVPCSAPPVQGSFPLWSRVSRPTPRGLCKALPWRKSRRKNGQLSRFLPILILEIHEKLMAVGACTQECMVLGHGPQRWGGGH